MAISMSERHKLEDALMKELQELTEQGGPVEHLTIITIEGGKGVLSGAPYLFSSDYVRAFIFRNRKQAAEILDAYGEILPGGASVSKGETSAASRKSQRRTGKAVEK